MKEISNMNGIDFANILGDRYSALILVATNNNPYGALDISRDFGIPIAACYRRINQLEKVGLLVKEDRVLTREGKRMWRYMSNIHMIAISFSDGRMSVKCELRNGYNNEKRNDEIHLMTK